MRELKFKSYWKNESSGEVTTDIIEIRISERSFSAGSKQSNYRDLIAFCQFTGLKDCRGHAVYEGDLLRRPAVSEWDRENFTAFEVFFHDGDAAGDHIGWVMNRTHHHGSLCGGYVPRFLPKNVSEMEVIGNIYANPELLKQ